MKFFLAEVRNIKDDPTKSGMVQVRRYGKDNDENDIKEKELPWAMVLQPTTSAALGGYGSTATGLMVGSRVLVTYLSTDIHEQQPIVIGSLARGADASEVNV